MRRKIGAFLLAFVLFTLMLTSAAFADSSKVEISFCVGDEILKINGTETAVEKPYVVGEGVTLVPLRVITEAFGATVEWIADTKTIKLAYPDVDIVLQIGNIVAEVNKKAETLLSAPELTANGFTMVPLRFISETFGAQVNYNEETKAITVVKENAETSNTGLEAAVTSKYIGDSYYGWVMENPVDMQMDMRYFDGTYTSFSYDEDNYIEVSIIDSDIEEYDFDKDFNETKSSFAGYTLVKADKKNDSNQKKMHFIAKDKSYYYEYIQIMNDKFMFMVTATFSNDDTKRRDEFVRCVETFAIATQADMHDLSNVKDDVRKFTAENARFSINVPHDFIMLSDEEAENEFSFCSILNSDDVSGINVGIYSKNEVGSAKKMAEKDFDGNKKLLNEKIVTFGASVNEMKIGEIDAYEYTYEVNSEVNKTFFKDVFFEVGEYAYNVSVSVNLTDKDYEKKVQTIFESIEALEIDAEKMGNIMRNLPEDTEGTFEYDKIADCKLIIPNNYTEAYGGENAVIFTHQRAGAVITVEAIIDKDQLKFDDAKEALKETESLMAKSGFKITEKTHETVIGGKKWLKLVAVNSDEESVTYAETFAIAKAGRIYMVSVVCDELVYSDSIRKEIETIIADMQFDKA